MRKRVPRLSTFSNLALDTVVLFQLYWGVTDEDQSLRSHEKFGDWTGILNYLQRPEWPGEPSILRSESKLRSSPET